MTNPGPNVFPQKNSSSTNSDGTFNPEGSAAAATTDPNSTHTDIYGLTPEQEQWSFYLAAGNNPFDSTVESRAARARLSRANPGEVHDGTPATYDTALGLMKKFSALGTSAKADERQAFAGLQNQLLAIGAYGTSGGEMLYRPGVWTDLDAKALLKAFQSYQQVAGKDGAGQPLTFSEYIDQAAGQSAANGQAGGTGAGKQPTQVSLTDPNQIRASAQQAAQQALGQGLSADQLDAFVNAFHASESGAQSSTDSSVTAPSLSSDALAFAEQSDPQHYANRQAQGYMNAFVNLFAPTQSQRANITPVPTI